jgi:hypothetical protein
MITKFKTVFFVFTILTGRAFADWQAPVLVDSLDFSYDRPDIQARNDTIYISCNNFFIRSVDGGFTWSDRREFGDWALLDVYSGLQGDTLLVYWATSPGYGAWISYSTDAGLSWQDSSYTGFRAGYSRFCRDNTIIYRSYSSDGVISFSKSDDFGLTWSDLRFIHIYDYPGTSYIYKRFDRLYILSIIPNAYSEGCNLRLLYSIDDGESWVNNDSLTSTFIGYGDPKLASSTNGRMAVVYHIWDPDWHMYDSSYVKISVSTDSGTTWTPPIDISHSTFQNCIPSLDMSGDTIVASWYSSQGMVVRRSYDLGQTWQDVEVLGSGDSNIALDNGTIHLAYLSHSQLLYRRWDPGTDVAEDNSPPATYSTPRAYPNPFNSATTITLTGAEQAEIGIYDITGRLIATLYTVGGRALWDASAYSSGLYFARLAGEKPSAIKLILLR